MEICNCECECRDATTIRIQGHSLCDSCRDFFVDNNEDHICSKIADGKTCHICQEDIRWIAVFEKSSNKCIGSCDCGEYTWLCEDEESDWGYSYTPPDIDL